MNKIKKLYGSLLSVLKQNQQKILTVLAMVLFFSLPSLAAGGDPFDSASTTITGYLPSVKKLLYALAAVIALVGAFNVYHKMTNGDQDVKKTIMLTLGGCIAMIALCQALPAFFGHTVAG